MITYMIKESLCTVLFLLAYKLLLEKEKMHQFKRFYLLFSLTLSFVVPLLTFSIKAPVVFANEPLLLHPQIAGMENYNQPFMQISSTINRSYILLATYISITGFILIYFGIHVRRLISKIDSAKIIFYKNAKLVLINEDVFPHSFLNYIFINKTDYESGNMEAEILLHELTHVQQRHSWDILLVQSIQALCWFNPFIFLYRKAMQLNHEFLADESVINTFHNTSSYQRLLIDKASTQSNSLLTSPFNYLMTKKRLVMITKKTSATVAIFTQTITVLSAAIIIFFFSTKTYSQTQTHRSQIKQENISYGQGASQELLHEYDSVLQNMTTIEIKKGKRTERVDMDKCNIDRMAYISKQMNEEQRAARNKTMATTFLSLSTPPTKKSPTATQLHAWADAKKYGLWLDGKRIANNELEKYQPTDIVLFWESKLSKNAINYGKHYYQVDLYTPAYYEEAYVKRVK